MLSVNKQKELEQNMTVYGFVRRCDIEIPNVLIDLCLLFYLKVFDGWSVEKGDERLKIDVDKNIVEFYGVSYLDAFGTLVMTKGDVESWTFSVSGISTHSIIRAAVGIADIAKLESNEKEGSFGAPAKRVGIVYHAGLAKKYVSVCGWITKKYGTKWRANEILTMTLDLTDDKYGKLSFKKDDEDMGVLYDKIDVNRTYCMGISVRSNCIIELKQE